MTRGGESDLANAPRIYRALAGRAEKEEWSYRDDLAVLMAEEVAHRRQTRLRKVGLLPGGPRGSSRWSGAARPPSPRPAWTASP